MHIWHDHYLLHHGSILLRAFMCNCQSLSPCALIKSSMISTRSIQVFQNVQSASVLNILPISVQSSAIMASLEVAGYYQTIYSPQLEWFHRWHLFLNRELFIQFHLIRWRASNASMWPRTALHALPSMTAYHMFNISEFSQHSYFALG